MNSESTRIDFRDGGWPALQGAGRSRAAAERKNGLTAFHIRDMVSNMKTTLNISDVTMREVKREAARRRQTMSEMVEAALRTIVEPTLREARLPPLPEFSSGGLRVNVANRDSLYNVMGG